MTRNEACMEINSNMDKPDDDFPYALLKEESILVPTGIEGQMTTVMKRTFVPLGWRWRPAVIQYRKA